MAEKEPDKSRAPILVSIPPNMVLPPAEGANFFHFTRVGSEIQFLVGMVNLIRLHEATQQRGEPSTVVPSISHRFLLSPLGFNHLRNQFDQITATLPKQVAEPHEGDGS